MPDEKGLNRGGVEGQEAELTNRIAPEGSLRERRPLPGQQQPPRARNPFMDKESQAHLDRERARRRDVE